MKSDEESRVILGCIHSTRFKPINPREKNARNIHSDESFIFFVYALSTDVQDGEVERY